MIEEYFNRLKKVREHYIKKYESRFNDYRRMDTAERDKYVNEKLPSLPISKELNALSKVDTLVSSDYNSLYPSAMAHHQSRWPKIETAKAILPESSDLLCDIFNKNNWKKLNKSGFFKVKYHNPDHLVLQHLAVNEEVLNENEHKYEKINRFRNGDIIDYVTSVDLEEIVRIGGVVLKFYEGFICDNLEFNPFFNFIIDMTAKRNYYKKEGKNILQSMCKAISLGSYGSCIRRDINENFKCVTENWMNAEFDDRVKNWFPLENGNYMVNIIDHVGVDDNGFSKKINSQPFHLGSFILSHSKRLMNDVILSLDGFRNHKIYNGDTDSVYIHKNDYKILNDKGLIGKDLGQSKNDYGDSAGIVYGLFLAPKVKYCITIDEFGVLSAKTTFKGYNQNINPITFKDYLNLECGQSIKNRSKLKWKREITGIQIPHRKINCDQCNENNRCESCQNQPKMNCMHCELSKSCKECLQRISRVTEYSVNINKLKRKAKNEQGYMLPYYKVENEIVHKKCSKCEIEIIPVNYIKNKTICRICHDKNMKERRKLNMIN